MKRIKPIQIDIDNPECSNSGIVFKGKNTNQPSSNNTIRLLNLTGYGNDFFVNFYEREFEERYFVLYKQKYWEINRDVIYNITWSKEN